MIVQYDGSRYKGWQSQKKTDATIQGKLAAVLEKFAGHPVEVQGSGRTDAGVHARGQVASFSLERESIPQEIMNYVNQYLPEDIGVIEVQEALPRFHARLSAVRKTYVYRIWNSSKPNVFERKWMHTIEEPLDVEAMKEAAEHIVGTHDFRCFQAAGGEEKETTVRTIHSLDIFRDGENVIIEVAGDGFLYNMVRIITGTLVEVGLGKKQAGDLPSIIDGLDRRKAGHTAPAEGLYLVEVYYEQT